MSSSLHNTKDREKDRQAKHFKERSPRDVANEEPNSFEIETEELDPRVQEELEKLNSCTDEINRLISFV